MVSSSKTALRQTIDEVRNSFLTCLPLKVPIKQEMKHSFLLMLVILIMILNFITLNDFVLMNSSETNSFVCS